MDKILEWILLNKYMVISVTIVIVIFIIIFMAVRNKSKKRNKADKGYNSNKRYTLDDCKSYEDIDFKIDTYQRSLENELSKNKKAIQEVKKKGYIKANTAWTERFQELTEVSNTLYKNLEYENSKKLNKDKFQRYTSLHFRSVILGNLAYKDYVDSKKVRDEISALLVAIGKKQVRVTSIEKRELYDVKDVCVKATKYLYDRMVAIQNKTGTLRDKIRDECGTRGREWYNKIQRNKK